jgi:hypothetical protein
MPEDPLEGYERALSGYTICATVLCVFAVGSKLTRILDGGEMEEDIMSEGADSEDNETGGTDSEDDSM